MLRTMIKNLPGYSDENPFFNRFFNTLSNSDAIFNPDAIELSPVYEHFLPIINQKNAIEAAKILYFVHYSLCNASVNVNKKPSNAVIRAGFNLLGSCPIEYANLISFGNGEGIQINDLLTPGRLIINDMPNCHVAELHQPETPLDNCLQKLQKRFFQGNIHVDSWGNVYHLDQRKLEGEQGLYHQDKIVSLIDGIDYSIILSLLKQFYYFSNPDALKAFCSLDLNLFSENDTIATLLIAHPSWIFSQYGVALLNKRCMPIGLSLQEEVTEEKLITCFNLQQEEDQRKLLEVFREHAWPTIKNPSEIQWLESLPFETAERMLTLLEKYFPPLAYNLIYNGSERLRRTDVMLRYAEGIKQSYEVKLKFQPHTISMEDPEEVKQEDIPGLDESTRQLIITQFYSIKTLCEKYLSEIENYRTINFYLKEEKWKPRYFVPKERVEAWHDLQQVIMQAENDQFAAFHRLYRDPAFRMAAGHTTSGFLSFLFAPSPLWPIVESLKQALELRVLFYNQFSNDRQLTALMNDDECYIALSRNEFENIYSVSNKSLFLEGVAKTDRLNHWEPIRVMGRDRRMFLDAESIHCMTTQDEYHLDRANMLRYRFGIQQKIPQTSELPGISENIEGLPKSLLYQYEGPDISAAEILIMKKYGRSLCNHFDKPLEGEEKCERPPAVLFFYVPVSVDPILCNPEKVSSPLMPRYKAFSEKLQSLLNTHDQVKYDTPIIFCGVANVEGVHYIPYFIYKNAQNEIQIITVDPSPQFKPWDDVSGEPCPKKSSHEMLKRIFTNIFRPSICSFNDPNVTQQLRQRDCGPNSLTVIEDALRQSMTQTPLLSVNPATDTLEINPAVLSVNFNLMRAYQYETHRYHYSSIAKSLGSENRQKWENRLRTLNISDAIGYSGDLNLKTQFKIVPIEEYSYEKNVAAQSNADQVSELYSKVAAVINLVGGIGDDIDAIRQEFVRSFDSGWEDRIEKIIGKITEQTKENQWEDMQEEALRNGTDLRTIVKYVLQNNVGEQYYPALLHHFKNYLSHYKIQSPNETETDIIERFLNDTRISPWYLRLRDSTKNELRQELMKQILLSIDTKRYNFHINYFGKILDQTILNIMQQLPRKFSVREVVNDLISHYSTDEQTAPSMHYLIWEHQNTMQDMLNQRVEKILADVSEPLLIDLNKMISNSSLDMLNHLCGSNPITLQNDTLLARLIAEGAHWSCLFMTGEPATAVNMNALGGMLIDKISARLNHLFNKQLESLLTEINTNIVSSFQSIKLESLLLFIHGKSDLLISDWMPAQISQLPADSYVVSRIHALLDQSIDKAAREACIKRFNLIAQIIRRHINLIPFISPGYFSHIAPDHYRQFIFDCLNYLSNCPEVTIEDRTFIHEFIFFKNDSLEFEFFYDSCGKNIVTEFVTKDAAISSLMQYANIRIDHLTKLLDIFSKFAEESNQQITSIREYLTESCRAIHEKQLLVYDNFNKTQIQLEQHIENVKSTIHKAFKNCLRLARECWQPGDIRPDHLGIRLRIFLCLLFNITPEKLHYYDSLTAAQLDERLQARIESFGKNTLLHTLPAHLSLPYYLDIKIKQNILMNDSLTSRQLYAIAIQWLKEYDKDLLTSCERIPSPLLAKLFEILNEMPHDENPLPKDWCQQHLSPLYKMRAINDRDEYFLEIIESSNSYADTLKQSNIESELVMKSSLNDSIAMYSGKSAQNEMTKFLDLMQAPMAENKKINPSHLQAGFFRRTFSSWSEDITRLDSMIQRIQKRHDMRFGDFPLDSTDISWLTRLLGQRWERLCRSIEQPGEFPKNYETFSLRTDRIWLHLALLVKAAIKNIDPNSQITAYSLLMPGRLPDNRAGIIQRDAMREEKYADPNDAILADIDDYEYKNIVTLPTGWVHGPALMSAYQTTGKLMNPFLGCDLTIAEVKHILSHHQDIAKQLHIIFYQHTAIIDKETTRVFLEYLHHSIFSNGFSGNYNHHQNYDARNAWVKLIKYVENLPTEKKKKLLNTPLPNSHQTLADAVFPPENQCITTSGMYIAQALWQERAELTENDFPECIRSRMKNYNFDKIKRKNAKPIEHIQPNERAFLEVLQGDRGVMLQV
ncbi:MAG: hypothetical protein SFW66_09135 [Gammaproteobacteria bacterium]|nr:hypothetical protein [Gammaproteobacteria bacterium]